MTRCQFCMKEYDERFVVCPHCGGILTKDAKEPYQLSPGTVLQKRYIIGAVIDYGGFSTVYKAWDDVLHVVVAIKEYYPAGLVQRVPGQLDVLPFSGHEKEFEKGIYRFLSEARNTNKLAKNRNIVNMQTFFEANGTAYIVMEYLDGCSLSKYLEEHEDKVNSDIAVNILLSVIAALRDVHREGIVHRDISPSNIFLCKDGTVKLIDFGAAKFPGEDDDIAGSIELKPGYAPPEQYQLQSEHGPWTDIYALGATLYKAVTGEIPEESTNRIIDDELKSPREIDKSIPAFLDKTLMKAMALVPELRFKNVDQFERAIQNKRHVKTLEKEIRRRKFRRVRRILIIASIILIAGGYGIIRYWLERMKEVLPARELTVWMVAADDAEAETKQQNFVEMCEEFTATYPQVTFAYRFFLPEEYEGAVDKAAILGDTPCIFEAADLSDYSLFYAAKEPSALFELVAKDSLYYSQEKYEKIVSNRKIPLGFDINVEAYNPSLLASFNDDIVNMPYLFNEGMLPIALLSLEEYHETREKMSGIYNVIEKPHIAYANNWCIGANVDIEERECVLRLLYYLLGEKAQENMGINQGTYLPVNKGIFKSYIDINPELRFLMDCLDEDTDIAMDSSDFGDVYAEEIEKKYDSIREMYSDR